MALADWAAFLAALESPRERVYGGKNAATAGAQAGVVGRWGSTWTNGSPRPGSAPTTAVVPTKATTGTYPFDSWQNSGAELRCVGGTVKADLHQPASSYISVFICDRLSHQGGLVGNVNTAQATNLPTAALTRYSSGAGVMMGIEIHTQIGTTATTVSVSYTNSSGTSGQASPAIAIGGNNFRDPGRFFILPFAVGDVGVRSVESLTLAASTGTAGALGVVLFKPLFAFVPDGMSEQHVDPVISGMVGGMPEILDDACLWTLLNCGATSTTMGYGVDLAFAET